MFNITEVGDRLVCTFPERMDTLACEQCQGRVEVELVPAGRPVTFDLGGVVYVSSSFLRICLKLAQAVGKERFDLVHVSPEVRKVFKIAGLDREFPLR